MVNDVTEMIVKVDRETFRALMGFFRGTSNALRTFLGNLCFATEFAQNF